MQTAKKYWSTREDLQNFDNFKIFAIVDAHICEYWCAVEFVGLQPFTLLTVSTFLSCLVTSPGADIAATNTVQSLPTPLQHRPGNASEQSSLATGTERKFHASNRTLPRELCGLNRLFTPSSFENDPTNFDLKLW